jgi:hypothetical protein
MDAVVLERFHLLIFIVEGDYTDCYLWSNTGVEAADST